MLLCRHAILCTGNALIHCPSVSHPAIPSFKVQWHSPAIRHGPLIVFDSRPRKAPARVTCTLHHSAGHMSTSNASKIIQVIMFSKTNQGQTSFTECHPEPILLIPGQWRHIMKTAYKIFDHQGGFGGSQQPHIPAPNKTWWAVEQLVSNNGALGWLGSMKPIPIKVKCLTMSNLLIYPE